MSDRIQRLRHPVEGLSKMNANPDSEAPDLMTAEPEQAKVLLENERIRVLEVRLKAGQAQATHSHPDHLVYPLSAYRIKHIAADGSTSIGERLPGELVWIPAESHAGENVGDTECHVLIVELKEPAPE